MRPQYNLDDTFFHNIDSEEKAYFLGFLYADGYIHDKRKYVYLTIQEDDKEILEKFSAILKTNKPLLFIKKKTPKTPNWKNQYRLSLTRKTVYSDLKRWGLYQGKSLTLTPCKIIGLSTNLLRHFLRGYFDGDGSFSYYKVRNTYGSSLSIVCTKEFNLFFSEFVKKNLNINSTLSKRFTDNTNCYNFRINGNKNVFKFLSFLYNDSNIFLKRKYDKYKLCNAKYETLDKSKSMRYMLHQYDMQDLEINRFKSIVSASKYFKIAPTTFKRNIKKGIYMGFRWEKILK